MTQHPPPVPDWMLERYALGELPPDQSEAIRARLQAEAEAVRAGLTPRGDLTARLEALQASDAAILEALPPRQVAAEIRRRQHLRRAEDEQTERRPARRWALGLAPVLVAAIVLFAVFGPSDTPSGYLDDDGGYVGPKGFDPHLVVYRDSGQAKAERLAQGAKARAGDMLRLAYVAGRAKHGVIVSIDGRGGVTLHYPAEPAGSTELSLDGEQLLGFSAELDDAPLYERYFMVTSTEPIDVQSVLDAAARLATSGEGADRGLPLPATLGQWSIRLDKDGR